MNRILAALVAAAFAFTALPAFSQSSMDKKGTDSSMEKKDGKKSAKKSKKSDKKSSKKSDKSKMDKKAETK